MKRIWFIIVALALCAGLASAQSLVDLAKKEKQRRQNNAEQGEEATELTLDKKSPASGGATPSDDPTDPDPAPASSSSSSDTKDEWDAIFQTYQYRYESARSNLRSLQSSLASCEQQKTEYQGQQRERDKADANRNGTSWIETEKKRERQQTYEPRNCDYYTREIASTKAKMQQIQTDASNEARRRRVLPGRARLN